jgi:hypothetical protein
VSVFLIAGCATEPSSPRNGSESTDVADVQDPPNTPEKPDIPETAAWEAASSIGAARELGAWEHYRLPNKKATRYLAQRVEERDSMQAHAVASASMLRRKLRVEAHDLGTLHFSWRVESLIPGADLSASATEDSPVRLVLAFDGDRSKFSTRNAMLSELTRTLTGELLPYATLIYAWCAQCDSGSVFTNSRTDRIRTQVLEAGAAGLGGWLEYSRDIRADFEAVFGEPPGALVTIGVMTDADNTKSRATGWYGPLKLLPPPRP